MMLGVSSTGIVPEETWRSDRMMVRKILTSSGLEKVLSIENLRVAFHGLKALVER